MTDQEERQLENRCQCPFCSKMRLTNSRTDQEDDGYPD